MMAAYLNRGVVIMNKIQRFSRVFKSVFYVLLLVYPLLVLSYWISPHTFTAFGMRFGIPAGTKIMHHMIWQEKAWGFSINLIPSLITMAVFYYLAKLFANYEQGKIFILASSRYLKRIGYLLLTNALIVPFVINPVVQAIITMHNPAGFRYAMITFGTVNLYYIFVSLIFILISWVMTEASKIKEDQQLTV
jgi:hypothetical protein